MRMVLEYLSASVMRMVSSQNLVTQINKFIINYYFLNTYNEYLFNFNKNIHFYYIRMLLEYNKNSFEFHVPRILKNSHYLEKISMQIMRNFY